jgi:hypothetical protein
MFRIQTLSVSFTGVFNIHGKLAAGDSVTPGLPRDDTVLIAAGDKH